MVTVPTSAGEIGIEELGVVLMHEHVFIRAEALQWGWPGFGGWDEEAEVAAARQRLGRLKQAGVDAIVDVTIPGLGRDPALVTRAAEGTGLKVLFATGYFAPDRLPHPFQFRGPGRLLDGDDRLLESMFERDVTMGIGNTGIRAAVLMVVTGVPGMTEGTERLARRRRQRQRADRHCDLHAGARPDQARPGPAASLRGAGRGPEPGADRALQRDD